MSTTSSGRRATIVFDFDGTLALGHGPVLAYARSVAAHAHPDYLDRVDTALAAFDAGDATYRDGYDVVGSLAAADGVSPDVTQAAYLASRAALGTADAPIDTIADLDGFLGTLAQHVRLVLATNAPDTGIGRVLDAWGVRDRFDAIHCTVGKPAGLVAVVADALEAGPVLAIGDIAENDLLPLQPLGAATVLVGATAAASTVDVTMRAATLADLRPDIEAWAATAASSPTPTPDAPSGIER